MYFLLSLLISFTMFFTEFKEPMYLFLLLINVLVISHMACKMEGHHYAQGIGQEYVRVKIPYYTGG